MSFDTLKGVTGGLGRLLLPLAFASSAYAVAPLPSYNVDISQTTVSGLSSGAFMANQLGVAYSSIFKGVGIFAGGTYDCAGQLNYTGCIYGASPSVTTSISRMNSWSGNQIDNVANIANQKIYIFTGTNDTTVGKSVTDQVYNLYVTTGHFVSSGNVRYDKTSNAAHTFPTDFSGTGDNACTSASSPYISNCNFDGAGTALQWMYGTLNARNNGTLTGSVIQFDQTEFLSGNGMDTTGWAYVPAACASGSACKVHVAIHGCLQGYATIGNRYIQNTGYNRWADTNNIIVLYPQAVADNTTHATSASGSLANPNGCWDWIGWYGKDFDQKTGKQLNAIKRMVDRLAAGYTGGGGGGGTPTIPSTPSGLAVTGTTASTASLSWAASSGATSYKIFRDGVQVGTSTSTSTVDSGLAAGTTYGYAVSALNTAGESARSTVVNATTQSSQPYSTSVSDTIANHYAAGRLNLTQYLQLGSKYGYTTVITLYLCGSTWTNSSTCGPFQY